MNLNDIIDEIESITSMLDHEEYPEIYDYLSSVSSAEPESSISGPTDVAYNLLDLDKPKNLPEIIIDFITEILEDAYANGDADAINDLGAQYYDGNRGFEQNYEEAFRCYSLAAEGGSTIAQENLGYCYYYGRTSPADYAKAFYYYSLGAFCGRITSLYKIGDMYLNGYYVNKNAKEAFNIYNHCLELMNDESTEKSAGPVYLRIGKCFLKGTGVNPDYKAALLCLQRAESFLWDMVKSGDTMYLESLNSAIELQQKAREKLSEQ